MTLQIARRAAIAVVAGGMLAVAGLMVAWALLRPVQPEPSETRDVGSGRVRRAPAT